MRGGRRPVLFPDVKVGMIFRRLALQREQDRAAWRFPQEKSAAREEMRHLCLSLIPKLRCKFLCSSVKSPKGSEPQ
ncbi:hypothetical protein MUG91_G2n245 [Manis pentadactyla]|nr:hypothetical protein MUG91_G2n245 [Manis pentadactyla]